MSRDLTDKADGSSFLKDESGDGRQPLFQEGDLAPGDMVAGRYKVESLIGRGAMGSVYLVDQLFLGKKFALKTLSPIVTSDVNLRRFQKEAQAASKLDHPNLVQALDFGMIDESRPFLVMDYVQGQTLAQHLTQNGVLSVEEALNIFIPLAFGMAYAHQEGVIHRDIKPANIILVSQNLFAKDVIPRIVDFGIAKLAESEGNDLTKTGEIFGTPLYMSPEQCSGHKMDARSDIYSLGCVMFEALTGEAPFRGNNALETMMKHVNEQPLTLKQGSLGKSFPPALETIVAKMLQKDPDLRYGSFLDVANALARLQSKNPSIVMSAPKLRTSAKNKLHLAGSIVALVVAAAVALAFYLQHHDIERAAVKERAGDPSKSSTMADSSQSFSSIVDSDSPIAFYSKIRSSLVGSGPNAVRVLDFGRDPAGIIWVSNKPENLVLGKDKGKAAKGRFDIPANRFICFCCNDDTIKRLHVLREFGPDTLTGLWISPSDVALSENSDSADTKLVDDILYLSTDLRSLQFIYVEGLVSEKGVQSLNRFPNLKLLTLKRLLLKPEAIAKLEVLSRLKRLRLVNLINGAEALKNRNATALQRLELHNCETKNSDLEPLTKLPLLTELAIVAEPKVTDECIKVLAKIPMLTGLKFEDCDNITPKAIPELAKLKSKLKMLRLPAKGWPQEDQLELRKLLGNNIDVAWTGEAKSGEVEINF